MAETYSERLARLSRLHYLHNQSDFSHTSIEEFEEWKGQLDLPQAEQTKWRVRRRFLSSYFQSLVDEHKHGRIKFEVLLERLHKASTEKDHALLGRAVMTALTHRPLPEGRFSGGPYLISYAHFLRWLAKQWDEGSEGTALQNDIKNEIEELIGKKFSGATLENWLKPGRHSK